MNSPTLESNLALFAAIKSGSSGAFERFFKEHYQALCRFAQGYLKDADSAEDIVQNTFFTFWQKREELHLTQSLKSYLYSIVRNACLNKLKSQKIRDDYGSQADSRFEPIDAQDHLQEMELSEKIDHAIEAMPTERQKIFLMSRNEGLKYREIAEKLGKSVKTVENQMGKALKYMREELAEFLTLLIFFNFF